MTTLEQKLNYTFQNPKLLQSALTHSSYANERTGLGSCNERLEFLGDSILGFTVTEYLYHNYPNMPEGKMTKLRAELVCEPSLVQIANHLNLGEHLNLGKGENQSGGRTRPSILADALEAVFAAILLDSGIAQTQTIILSLLEESLKSGGTNNAKDYKTTLQEFVQQKSGQELRYQLIAATGPDHQKVFSVEVLLNNIPVGQGEGRSKKEAEQKAAEAALKKLTEV